VTGLRIESFGASGAVSGATGPQLVRLQAAVRWACGVGETKAAPGRNQAPLLSGNASENIHLADNSARGGL